MNNVSDEEFLNELIKRSEDFADQECRKYAVKELEKIKGEIIACTQQEEGEVPACINYGLNLSIEIIDNHIAELKGENNES